MKKLVALIICLSLTVAFTGCKKIEDESKPFEKRDGAPWHGVDLKKDLKDEKAENKKEK